MNANRLAQATIETREVVIEPPDARLAGLLTIPPVHEGSPSSPMAAAPPAIRRAIALSPRRCSGRGPGRSCSTSSARRKRPSTRPHATIDLISVCWRVGWLGRSTGWQLSPRRASSPSASSAPASARRQHCRPPPRARTASGPLSAGTADPIWPAPRSAGSPHRWRWPPWRATGSCRSLRHWAL